MKRLLFILVAFLSIMTAGATKRALFVAIGNYPAKSGWVRINSQNDVDLLAPVFRNAGFIVTTLVDEQATHEGIINAFKSLTNQCKSGDQVFIHFSCHGQQMIDQVGDEPDGLTEAMVPYDAKREPTKTYHGQNHFTDDKFNNCLNTLRKKIGKSGQLLVTLDACHSGDGTRGDYGEELNVSIIGEQRGVSDIFCPNPPFNKKVVYRGHTLRKPKGKGYSPMIALCACQPDQVSREYKDRRSGKAYGPLSYLIWLEAKDEKIINFKRLADAIIKNNSFVMKRHQQPYIIVE